MKTQAHTGCRQFRMSRGATPLEHNGEPAASAMNGTREKAMTAGCDNFDIRPQMPLRVFGKIQMQMPAERAS